MERNLLFFSLVLATLGLLGGFVVHRPKQEAPWVDRVPERERSYWWLAVVLAFLVFFVTLPGKPPFAPGANFGYGFLAGTLLFLLAARVRRRVDDGVPFAFVFSGVMSVSAVLAFTKGGEQDGLAGAALGSGVAGLILAVAAGEKGEALAWARSLKIGAGFSVLTAAMAALGLLRDAVDSPANPVAAPGLWSAAGLSLTVLVGIGATVAAFLERKDGLPGVLGRGGALLWEEDSAARTAGVVLTALIGLAAAAFLGLTILQEPGFTGLFALGIVTGLLMLSLSREGSLENRPGGFAAPLATLVLVGAYMGAFAVLQGFGAAVMLAGAGVSLLFCPGAKAGYAVKVWLLGLGLVVYRLYASRYASELRGSELTESYALFGIVLGAVLPTLPVLVAREATSSSLARLLAAGLVALAAPSAVVMFYGAKAGVTLLVGLALSCGLRGGGIAALWATVMALAVTQLGGHLIPLADMTRLDRLKYLLATAVVMTAILLGSEVAGRLRRRK